MATMYQYKDGRVIGTMYKIADTEIQRHIIARLYLSATSMLTPVDYLLIEYKGKMYRIDRDVNGGYTKVQQ